VKQDFGRHPGIVNTSMRNPVEIHTELRQSLAHSEAFALAGQH
jgi:hypothetical protein